MMKNKEEIFITFEQALNIILGSASPLDSETIQLRDASGRILYNDIISTINIPPFNNSAMDGFAVQFSCTKGASAENPIEMAIIGEIQAGGIYKGNTPLEYTAIRIMTGAIIPEGYDAVIPVEYTKEDILKGTLQIFKELKVNENIRFAGEDIQTGRMVLQKGTKLMSAEIGILASLNMPEVAVYKKPRVAIISTGNEIVEVGHECGPGHIHNSNAYTLIAEIPKYHGIPYYLGIARDSTSATKELFIKALHYDMIISTGGVSMGKYDFVKEVLADIEVQIKINTIRMKPGKPLLFGVKGRTLIFGLPGNPVSTMVASLEFVRPALLKMSGALKIHKPEVSAILDDPIKKKAGRREFLRGRYSIKNGIIHVGTTGPQGSGILRSMSEANCLIVLPEETQNIESGNMVTIQLIHHEEIG